MRRGWGRVWSALLLALFAAGLVADTGLPGPRQPSDQAIRQLTLRRVLPGGGVVLDSDPALAGQEVGITVYGPVGGRSAQVERGADFFGMAGVQLPWLPPQDQEAEMILAAASGARAIGLDFEWKSIQPEANRWDWEKTDTVVRLAKKYGLKVVPMLVFTPAWASRLPYSPLDFHRAPPVRSSLYRSFVYQVVSRYKPYGALAETRDGYGITDWVIWNEPNVQNAGRDPLPMNFWYGSIEEYILLLRAGYEGAHAADPSCNVLNAGLADVYWEPGRADLMTSLDRLYDPDGDGNTRDGARPYFDTLNLHMYVPGTKPDGSLDPLWYQDRMDMVLRLMERYGDAGKKIWITETGFGAAQQDELMFLPPGGLPLVSEAKQAEAVSYAYQTLAAYPQVERVFWWSLRNLSGSEYPTDPAMEAHYGLVRANFHPRPAYLAFLEMTGTALAHTGAANLDPSGMTIFMIPPERVQRSGNYLIVAALKSDRDLPAGVGWLAVP